MLETAAKYYTKTADLIRNQKDLQSDSRSALYNQLLVEEVLLFYKICKIKGIIYTKMLYYFETLIERLQALKNHDLMLKITLDLIDTFKFKVNEMNPVDHYPYV
jgi:hypothetical protein